MSLKIVQGNLITMAEQGMFDVIVHGCNCECIMGAGIAKQIAERWPKAYEVDVRTGSGRNKLGCFTRAEITERFTIVNAYTQLRPGRCFDANAFRVVLGGICKSFSGKRIGMPQIGCGLGGARWENVKKIIEEETEGEDITVVEYQGA